MDADRRDEGRRGPDDGKTTAVLAGVTVALVAVALVAGPAGDALGELLEVPGETTRLANDGTRDDAPAASHRDRPGHDLGDMDCPPEDLPGPDDLPGAPDLPGPDVTPPQNPSTPSRPADPVRPATPDGVRDPAWVADGPVDARVATGL